MRAIGIILAAFRAAHFSARLESHLDRDLDGTCRARCHNPPPLRAENEFQHHDTRGMAAAVGLIIDDAIDDGRHIVGASPDTVKPIRIRASGRSKRVHSHWPFFRGHDHQFSRHWRFSPA